MRIGMNVSVLERLGGMQVYTHALLEGLETVGQEHDFFLYGPPASLATVPCQPNFHPREVSLPCLHAAVARDHLDVFHGPDYHVPATRSCPTVVTIHDTLIQIHPDDDFREAHLREMLLCAEFAARILTVSHHAASAIEQDFMIAQEKIDVVHNGISARYRRIAPERARAMIEPLGIVPPYILYTGAISPRKNLKTLLAAFEQVRQQYARPLRLVITKGMCQGEVVAELAEVLHAFPDLIPRQRTPHLCFSDSLLLTDLVDVDTIIALYNLASVVVYPSLAEGFGLPPLEAMACGAPVVASNTSCLPEILGGAIPLFDPMDYQGFATAMLRLLHDTAFAEAMRERGLEFVRQYSVQHMATKTLSVFEKAVREGIRRG